MGDETWITLSARMNGTLRLQRALQGVEGTVVIDLSAVSGANDEGMDRFLHALRSLGREVHALRLVGCPYGLVQRCVEATESGRGGSAHPDRVGAGARPL